MKAIYTEQSNKQENMENTNSIKYNETRKNNKYMTKYIYFIKKTEKILNILELLFVFNVIIARRIYFTKKYFNEIMENSFSTTRYSYDHCILLTTREVGIWTN